MSSSHDYSWSAVSSKLIVLWCEAWLLYMITTKLCINQPGCINICARHHQCISMTRPQTHIFHTNSSSWLSKLCQRNVGSIRFSDAYIAPPNCTLQIKFSYLSHLQCKWHTNWLEHSKHQLAEMHVYTIFSYREEIIKTGLFFLKLFLFAQRTQKKLASPKLQKREKML